MLKLSPSAQLQLGGLGALVAAQVALQGVESAQFRVSQPGGDACAHPLAERLQGRRLPGLAGQIGQRQGDGEVARSPGQEVFQQGLGLGKVAQGGVDLGRGRLGRDVEKMGSADVVGHGPGPVFVAGGQQAAGLQGLGGDGGAAALAALHDFKGVGIASGQKEPLGLIVQQAQDRPKLQEQLIQQNQNLVRLAPAQQIVQQLIPHLWGQSRHLAAGQGDGFEQGRMCRS